MGGMARGFRYPFGEESCEHEMEVLKDQYWDFYYDKSRFHEEALNKDVYIIVGRRGAGKTSLARYFEKNGKFKNVVIINQAEIYEELYDKLEPILIGRNAIKTFQVQRIWNYIFWVLLLDKFKKTNLLTSILSTATSAAKHGSTANIVLNALGSLFKRIVSDSGEALSSSLDKALINKISRLGAEHIASLTSHNPTVIVVDTLERYNKNDDVLMIITAALIQSADEFNKRFSSHQGIHVKVLISDEIFPYIREMYVENVTKHIRTPLYLYWSSKDILRLLAWRFYKYIEYNRIERLPDVDWEDFDDILNKLWFPYWGETVKNSRGLEEPTFPYILRHTHMLPRQSVVFCNYIAQAAVKEGVFPYFYKLDIATLIREVEMHLATEIVNAYAKIYPGINDIIHALDKAPAKFEARYLDKLAKKTAYAWPRGEYSLSAFKRLVTETGIVGRIRQGPDERTRIVEADFEYSTPNRIMLAEDDLCVIHPLFYRILRIEMEDDIIVYPFPRHDSESLQNSYNY